MAKLGTRIRYALILTAMLSFGNAVIHIFCMVIFQGNAVKYRGNALMLVVHTMQAMHSNWGTAVKSRGTALKIQGNLVWGFHTVYFGASPWIPYLRIPWDLLAIGWKPLRPDPWWWKGCIAKGSWFITCLRNSLGRWCFGLGWLVQGAGSTWWWLGSWSCGSALPSCSAFGFKIFRLCPLVIFHGAI